jgi:hypothetical protein
MKKNKKQLNEFSLIAILGAIAFFGWISGFFSKLADNVDAYYHGRSVEVQRALKKIIKSLSKNKSFLSKIDNFVERYGIGPGMINSIMNTTDVKNLLNSYKNKSDINYDELNNELTKVLTKAMYDEADSRGMIDKIEKKIKNTNWD